MTSELEKKLILFFKSNYFIGLIKGIHTCVPDNANYPHIKINFLKKEHFYESIESLNCIDANIEVITNDFSNKNCLKILNKIEEVNLNDEISFEHLDQYYFKKNSSNVSQNIDGFWKADLSIYFLYINLE